MNNPNISVLMAVYNGERYLRESVDSVLNQTYTDFEFLIINDGSTDSSLDIINKIKDPRIRLVNNDENIGLTLSLNKGIMLARGEYIARIDADDISHSTRFEKQLKYFNENKNIVLLGTQSNIIDNLGKEVKMVNGWQRPLNNMEIRFFCMFDNPFIHSSVMFKTTVIKDIYKGYDAKYITNQDYDLWSRIVYHHDTANLDEKLISFRYHNESVSQKYNINSYNNMKQTMEYSINNGINSPPPKMFVEKWVDATTRRYKTTNSEIYKTYIQFENICNELELNRAEVFNDKSYQYFKSKILYRYLSISAQNNKWGSVRIMMRMLNTRYQLSFLEISKLLINLVGVRDLIKYFQKLVTLKR